NSQCRLGRDGSECDNSIHSHEERTRQTKGAEMLVKPGTASGMLRVTPPLGFASDDVAELTIDLIRDWANSRSASAGPIVPLAMKALVVATWRMVFSSACPNPKARIFGREVQFWSVTS